MKISILFAALLACLATVAGNTALAFDDQRSISAGTYNGSRALSLGEAHEMEVVQVRDIMIKPDTSMMQQGTGAAVGGTLGGLAGSQMGKGNGRTAATVLGGLLGGLGGAALASPSAVEAQEVVLRKIGSEKMVVVVQAGRELAEGDAVLVVVVGDEFRVSKRTKRTM